MHVHDRLDVGPWQRVEQVVVRRFGGDGGGDDVEQSGWCAPLHDRVTFAGLSGRNLWEISYYKGFFELDLSRTVTHKYVYITYFDNPRHLQ